MDWEGLMRAGLQGLRLEPRVFWALTPAELALMLGLPSVARPLGRDGLAALMRQWPDGGDVAQPQVGPVEGKR